MKWTTIFLLGGATLFADTPACPPSPNLGASLSAAASVDFDAATKTYRYQYVFTNNGTREIGDIYVFVGERSQVKRVTAPSGWDGDLFSGDERYVRWTAVPAPVSDENSAAFVPPPARLKPGERLSGFSFTSVLQPGAVRLLVEAVNPPLDAAGNPIVASDREGLHALAENAGEELAERGCNIDSINHAVALSTEGPADTVTVRIMIKPDQPPPAPLGPKSRGIVPVAILAADGFDPASVDPATVTIGTGAAKSAKSSLEDVNADTKLDLMLHFDAEQIGVRCQDASLALTGKTRDGRGIQGFQAIRTVGCK